MQKYTTCGIIGQLNGGALEVKLFEVVNSGEAMTYIGGLSMPIEAAYWVVTTNRALEAHGKDFNDAVTKERQKFLDKKGEFINTEKNLVTLQEEANKLSDKNVELDVEKTTLKELGIDMLEPKYLARIMFLLEDL